MQNMSFFMDFFTFSMYTMKVFKIDKRVNKPEQICDFLQKKSKQKLL